MSSRNLEWCTCKENQNHSWTVLKRKSNKQKAEQLDKLIELYKKGDWDKVSKLFGALSNAYEVDIVVYKWEEN